MAKENKVIVYSTEWCPWCHRVKEWLTKQGVRYEDRDVEKEPKFAEEMTNKTKQSGIPVVDINGEVIIGYNEPVMRKALGIK
ncbi:MAG: glutaredoxin domain-containing protein [Candidatus Micrarchaeota archaeon]